MNELQKKEFELLVVFDDICKSLNLEYFMVCGSVLGTVKYDGFIPWDDDIDVAMLRPQYEIFIREAQKLLPYNLFLQNYHTEKHFPYIYSKLRNSETTYIEKSVKHLKMNHGIGIDIFPLDGYPKSKVVSLVLEVRKHIYQLQISSSFEGKKTWKSGLVYFVGKILMWDKRTYKIVRKFDSLVQRYSINSSEVICNHGNWQGKLEYAPREQYGQGVMKKFESMDVRIPERYEEYLTQKYGEWRVDPPIEEQIGHHYYTILDLKNSYTKYI